MYGFYLKGGMEYGLSQFYGLWDANPCEPSWWTDTAMGYNRLWVITGMGYGRFDCIDVMERLPFLQ